MSSLGTRTSQLRLGLAAICLAGALWLGGALRDEHRLRSAHAALAAGHAAEAARRADAISGHMVDARARQIEARAALLQGDLRGARAALRRAVHAIPNDWAVHRDLAVVLLRLDRRTAARREITRALALNPKLVLPPGFAPPRAP